MNIREYHKDDYDKLIDLWNKSKLPYKIKGRDRINKINKEIKGKNSIFLVVEIDNELIGSVFGSHDGRKG